MKLTKLLLLIISLTQTVFSVDILLEQNSTETSNLSTQTKAYFGEQIFRGNFKENKQFRYNANYLINVGDVIAVKMWGSYEFSEDLVVDQQGNIFIPKVGEIHVLGLENRKLKSTLKRHVKRVFNDSVFVYADIQQYQPISLFVSGSVNQVGLYEGLSTDSILQFIDKAGGIIRGQGSYRNISVLRNKQLLKRIDLYQFLLDGAVESFQFKNGDVIFVNPVESYIEVEGDVNRPYIFELSNRESTVDEVMHFIMPKPTTNKFMLTQWENEEETTKEYPISDANRVMVHNGSKLKFFSNYYINNVEVEISGEHRGPNNITVKKGTTLYDVLENIQFTALSEINNIRLYRQSVANIQKQLIETKLKDLESRAFTYDSSTPEEAAIRAKEAELISQFIERVREIEPLGQVIINSEDNLDKIYLEEGDRVVIPKRSNVVVVQGEVNIPNALAHRENYTVEDYINSCGGYGDRANKDKVLIIRANGEVVQYQSQNSFALSSAPKVYAGDSILVLGKVDSKSILITSSVTQILYQIAVGAAVVLRAF